MDEVKECGRMEGRRQGLRLLQGAGRGFMQSKEEGLGLRIKAGVGMGVGARNQVVWWL